MQVHSQPLCGPPADIPLLEGDPVEGLPQHQDVLQERIAAQSYKNHNSTAPPRLSPKGSLSPSENASTQHSITTGAYYTGNVHAQHVGLAGFGVERSEKQIRCELGRLYKLLQRSEKYQTYREKQPALTPAEVVARDAAERKEQEKRKAQGLQQEKDKTVWPDFLEHAFWIALVRWPPMGRKKYMLEGTQRGRNELIQDSIYRDTGIRRDRKQVSSHLQVLKDKLRGVPAVLLYMTTPEDVTKRRCTNTPVLASHSSHVHGRQHAQRTDLPTKYEYSTSSPHVWPQHGGPQPDLTLSFGPDSDPLSSPFTVTRFEMIVESDHQSVHCLTQMHSNGRLGSFEVLDLASWRRQYRDLDFLLSETESWMRSGRKVLVCTASIGSMAGVPSDADLITTFDLDSHVDLSTYDHLECMTRFYEDQDDAVDAQFDSTKQYREEERTSCEYQSGLQGSKGVLRVDFGAQTWIRQMREYQYMRHRDEEDVREPLQYLTATQDIYGIVSQAGKAQCLLTVLWRFNQTENSAEVGSMEWRSVNFASCRSAAEERWCHETEHKTEDVEDMEVGHEKTANNPMFTPPDVTSYHQASQLPPDFAQTHVTRHPYETEPHHHHQPPSLSIDILGSMQPDLDHLDSSAATTTTEFSQQSFALSHTQGMGPSNTHSNDFDFNCSHIPISGAFDSTMNMPVYGSFPNQSAGLGGLHTLAGLEHDEFSTMGLAIGENGQLVPVDTSNDLHDSTILSCYSTKPHWQHACLISHLENAAEQYNSYPIHDDRARGVYNQEVIPGHDAYAQVGQREESAATNLHDFNHSLWGLQELQSPFQDDTGSGAVRGLDYRKEQTYGSDYGVPDLVEKRQKGCGY